MSDFWVLGLASSGLRVNLHALRLSLRGTVHSVLRIMSFPKLCLIRTLIQDLLCLATHAYVELVTLNIMFIPVLYLK